MNPRALYLVKRIEIELTARMTRALAEYKLTPVQFTVLYFVDHEQGDLSSAQLSRRFSMTPQSMNELVTVLMNKGLLKKSTSPNHKRILHLTLTEKGKSLLKKCNSTLDEIEDSILRALSDREVLLFKKIIGKLINSLRN